MVAAPNAPVDSLSFVTDAERRALLDTFNATGLAPSELMRAEQTIHGMLEHWAAATPDAPAASFEVRTEIFSSAQAYPTPQMTLATTTANVTVDAKKSQSCQTCALSFWWDIAG